MLIVVHKGREEEVKRIFDKWDLPWSEIGIINRHRPHGRAPRRQTRRGHSARKIADESPVYQREAVEPAYLKDVRAFRLDGIADTTTPADDLKKLPRVAEHRVEELGVSPIRSSSSRRLSRPARQRRGGDSIKADSIPVQGASLQGGTGDSPVASGNLPEASDRLVAGQNRPVACSTQTKEFPEKLFAMTVDCNGGYVYLDPYEGAKAAVAEACRISSLLRRFAARRNGQSQHAQPAQAPSCFGRSRNPCAVSPKVAKRSTRPVTGGNCSLYNQSPAGPIDPTPTISVVGLIEKLEHVTTQWFKDEGDAIILLGEAVDKADPIFGLGGSAYLQVIHGKKNGSPPRCDLEIAKTLHTTLIGLIQSGLVKSAHDCSEGGLAVALAESCISQLIARDTPRLIGATIDLSSVGRESSRAQTSEGGEKSGLDGVSPHRLDALLFGETQSRIVISSKPLDAVKVVERAKLMAFPPFRSAKSAATSSPVKTASGEFSRPAYRTARRMVEFHCARDGMK